MATDPDSPLKWAIGTQKGTLYWYSIVAYLVTHTLQNKGEDEDLRCGYFVVFRPFECRNAHIQSKI